MLSFLICTVLLGIIMFRVLNKFIFFVIAAVACFVTLFVAPQIVFLSLVFWAFGKVFNRAFARD